MSNLRHDFDFTWKFRYHPAVRFGCCWPLQIAPQMSGDMEKLEKMLGCRVAGANLKDLLAGEDTFPSWHKFF